MQKQVGGVICDESVILGQEDDDGENACSLQPGAEIAFRLLSHTQIRTGISYGVGLPNHKVSLLQQIACMYSFHCFKLNMDDPLHEITLTWGDIKGSILYLVCNRKKEVFSKISSCGWLIVVPNVKGCNSIKSLNITYIEKLEELPLTICQLNKKVAARDILTVGYMMKPSRKDDFAKRGTFPLYPTENGLVFMPLTFELPLSPQLQEVDVILHKATDEILSIEFDATAELPCRVTYSRGMQELQRYMESHPDCCVIDPLNDIYPLLNRLNIQQILLGMKDLKTEGSCIIRGPHFLKVDSFNDPNLVSRLEEARLSLPSIVKPQVACGVSCAHNMAIVFRMDDMKSLSVPLPAVIQEYVDHSSTLYKFYVLGENVFYAMKKSTPNADILVRLAESDKPLIFDSLKSLPTGSDDQHSGVGGNSKINNQSIDISVVTNAAHWLRAKLNLTIFGFDVVIQEGTGDHVIVDVNYLPSFKEVPDDIAIPAFWKAVKEKYDSKMSRRK